MKIMTTKISSCAFAAALLILAVNAAAVTLHVAPDGSDQAQGSEEHPFRTLARARDAVRKLRYSEPWPDHGVGVVLHGGRYELDEPLWLTEVDSGQPGAPVVYRATDEGEAVISGGRIVTAWTEGSDGIWKAPVKGLFRQVYIDGRRGVRASSSTENEPYYRVRDWDRRKQTAIVPLEAVAGLKNAASAEFIVQTIWSQVILRIASIERRENDAVIAFRNPESTWLFNRRFPSPVKNATFHIENHLALLDRPGEWYHDTAQGLLYYRPRENEDMSKSVVTVPRLETLVRIEGTPESPVQDVEFRGLTFEESNWERPSHIGVQGVQAGMFTIFASMDNTQILGRPPAAIDMEGAKRIRVEGNIFRNLGATGVDLRHATAECAVVGNVFQEIAGGPVRHGMFSPPDQDHHFVFLPAEMREVCTDDVIANNLITRSALDYPGNCAIASGFVRGVRIEHNTITHMPYSAISVGWGWNKAANCMADNRIRYNHIDSVMELLVDGGAIYTLSPQRDSEIAYNLISNVERSKSSATSHWAAGIYLDEQSDYLHHHHNVMRNVHTFHAYNGNGKHNQRGPDFTFDRNEAFSEEARRISEQAGLEPAYQELLKSAEGVK